MRVFLRAGLAVFFLLLFFCQGTAAWNVMSISADPSGSLISGTPVKMEATIIFNPSSNDTLTPVHGLQIDTDLVKPRWEYTVSNEGGEQVRSPIKETQILTIRGSEMPVTLSEFSSLTIIMKGITPDIGRTQNITLLRIREIDEKGILINTSQVVRSGTVVDTPCCTIRTDGIDGTLQTYRTHIDEKNRMGINTGESEKLYVNATENLAIAKRLPATRYLEYFSILDSAQTDIDNGERHLDKAWAEKEVADAGQQVSRADAMIGWFMANTSTANLNGLPPIISKRDQAAGYLATAGNEMQAGRYSLARSNATLASETAIESYNEGLNFSYGVTPCCVYFGPYADREITSEFIIAGFLAILFLVAGILWWRRQKRVPLQ